MFLPIKQYKTRSYLSEREIKHKAVAIYLFFKYVTVGQFQENIDFLFVSFFLIKYAH